jgi:RND superfamily putative drug exporter
VVTEVVPGGRAKRKPLTVRIARWSATHPWSAMVLWTVCVAASLLIGSLVGTVNSDDAGIVREAARAERMIKEGRLPQDPVVERVLVSTRSGEPDHAAMLAAAADLTRRMRELPGVAVVQEPVPSPDNRTLLLSVAMAGDPTTAPERVGPLLATTAAVQRDHPALVVEQVGAASIGKGLSDTVDKDFQRAELISLPVTLVILLVAFGALVAAAVPLLLALSAVISAIGLFALASHVVPGQESVNSVILLIGMAVGVDYSLFYVRREREERARGAAQIDAVEIAAATSGHAVVVSGIAVIISMAGMFLANDTIFASLATGSILVVGMAVVGSLTVLPALLAKLGRWVDRPRVPLVLRPALRYPIPTLALSVGALAALAAPAFGMTLKLSGIQDVPRSIPIMRTYDRMAATFPGTGAQHVIVVKASPAQAGDLKAALEKLGTLASTDPLLAPGQPNAVKASPDGAVMVTTLATPFVSGTDGAQRSLDHVRDTLLPATIGTVPGATYAVSGEIAITSDYSEHVRQKLPVVVGFVLLLTFVVMTYTFRSLVVAITAIGLNMLSVGAAYGLIVLVFQRSWAEGVLDFRSNGSIVSWVPLFLFVVLFGLSMDYHVFVVSRIREEVLLGEPNNRAVVRGITTSAGVVTSAAVVMVGVFAVFGTLRTLDMKQLGVGLASAILIDATIIRAVVLPSLMMLLGRSNWWAPRVLHAYWHDARHARRDTVGHHRGPRPRPGGYPLAQAGSAR